MLGQEDRVIIIGGPRCGKSTRARQLREEGIPTYCSDPHGTEEAVIYLPHGLDWSAGSDFIAKNWLTLPAPWCCEGVGMVRAMRKLIQQGNGRLLQGIQVIYLQQPFIPWTAKQQQMAKAVATIWQDIAPFITGGGNDTATGL
jgi:hypothetical protein